MQSEFIAKIAAYAEMFDYPCSKQGLLQMANEQEMPDDILNVLEDLPSGRYKSNEEVVDAAVLSFSEKVAA